MSATLAESVEKITAEIRDNPVVVNASLTVDKKLTALSPVLKQKIADTIRDHLAEAHDEAESVLAALESGFYAAESRVTAQAHDALFDHVTEEFTGVHGLIREFEQHTHQDMAKLSGMTVGVLIVSVLLFVIGMASAFHH